MASKGMLSAPVMTFYFNDGSVFQMDFRDPALLTKDVSRISLLGVFGIFFIKRMHGDRRTGMEAIKPFEEYFRRKGLLPS